MLNIALNIEIFATTCNVDEELLTNSEHISYLVLRPHGGLNDIFIVQIYKQNTICEFTK